MAESNRVFTEEELAELCVFPPDRIRQAIREGDFERAREAFDQMHDEGVVFLHDGFFTWIAGDLTWIYDKYGEAGLKDALDCVGDLMRKTMMPSLPQKEADVTARNIAAMLRGVCKQQFTMEEDEEKVVFNLCPCGNGGRLVDMGYNPDVGLARLQGPCPLSYGQDELPIFCSHCAKKELRDFEELGHLQLIHAADLDGQPKGTSCQLVLYKDPDDIPERYYERLGLEKPGKSGFAPHKTKQMFSQGELDLMSTNTEDLVREALDAHDAERALELFTRYYDEHTYMHDCATGFTSSLHTWLYENHGIDELVECEVFGHTIEGQIALPQVVTSDFRELVTTHVKRTCGHFYQPVTSIVEDDDKVTVRVNRCGSGGRLIESGAYGKGLATIKDGGAATWGLEEFPAYCIHCPVMEKMLLDEAGFFTWTRSPETTSCPKTPYCDYEIWKDQSKIPAFYYERIGATKPE